jgi:hypothetical protein
MTDRAFDCMQNEVARERERRAPAVEPEQRQEARRELMVKHKGAYEALSDEPEQPNDHTSSEQRSHELRDKTTCTHGPMCQWCKPTGPDQGKTTNAADECRPPRTNRDWFEYGKADERARIERIIESMPDRTINTGEKCEHGQFGYEDCIDCYRADLLAAIRGGDDA